MPNKPTYKELEDKVKQLEAQVSQLESTHKESLNNMQMVQTLLDTIPSPIFYKDRDGIYQNCNDAFCEMILGIEKKQIIQKSLFDLPNLIPHELAAVYYAKDKKLFDSPGTQIYRASVQCSDGGIRDFSFYKATVTNEANTVIGIVGVMLDITELELHKSELKEKNSLLEHLSSTDPLTGLFNRRNFDSVFSEQLKLSSRHDCILNFAMLDVDNFKSYNDTYGHSMGDNVLQLIAKTLQQTLSRPDDYVFRLGGEEFGLLFFSIDEESALLFANTIRLTIQELGIEHINNEEFKVVTLSSGLTSIKHHPADPSLIYEIADKSLYQAKQTGKNKIISTLL